MTPLDQIRRQRADLARQRAALDKRDAELAIAEKVLAELEGAVASPAPSTMELLLSAPTASRRERVVEALSGERVWMTSREINNAIAKRHGMLIKSTSLLPMLTNLKNEGVVVRDGDKIALKERVEGGSAVQD